MRRLTSLRHLAAAAAHWLSVSADCDPNPALASTVEIDFTAQPDVAPFEILEGRRVRVEPDEGAVFVIETEKQAPTLFLPQYIFFGRVEIVLRAARGKGIVTSLMLQSDTLDEVYFEWIGSESEQVQTNYVRNGNATGFDRGANHTVKAPADEFHNYTIDWTKDRIEWFIDGTRVRRLINEDTEHESRFPQTPATLKIGTWVAGREEASNGTVEWAGGMADFDQSPFIATVQRVKVTDYANGVDDAAEYVYLNKSTMWDSIDVSTGRHKSDGLGSGVIAGIVIGAVALCAIIGAGCFVLSRWRRRKRKSPEEGPGVSDALLTGGKGELDGRPSEKVAAHENISSPQKSPQELEGQGPTKWRPVSELGGREIVGELDGCGSRAP